MKKLFLVFISLIIALGFTLNQGCSPSNDDLEGPVIIIYGDNPVTISLGSNWLDYVPHPQANAWDNWSGIIEWGYEENINKDSVGEYIVIYYAVDLSNNETTAERIVFVINNAEKYDGTYDVINVINEVSHEYEQTITSSYNVNYRIDFSKFAYNANGTIYGNISENTITIPSQQIDNISFYGSGTISTSGNITTFVIHYTENSLIGMTTFTKK
ncbi:MAG: hypothetical protein K8S00_06825 [Bacteroidales bacterium]|nr:hypothetical protein [Bacteroidales bacterium]